MTHSQRYAAVALGSALLVAALVAFVPSLPPASAQSQADRICQRQGIGPSNAGYEFCLAQATRALEWNEPEAAQVMARLTADARDACLANDLQPATIEYRACMESETYARSLLIYGDEPQYGPEIANP